ncbi:MAG: hypothetical protein IPJ98_29245 [Bryobacterales bacterium]|nr:hypothetical protein [Bryobacterales bacterium]MBN8730516.1 hypothetical protein [Acidobacteriota bacterium]
MKLKSTSFFVTGLLLFGLSISSFATVEMSKKEKQKCTACHVKMGKKDLNDVGKCYEAKKSMSACAAK